MFPLYDTSGITYDNLSEIRPGGIWTGLATVAAVAGRGPAALAARALAGVAALNRVATTRPRPAPHI